MPPVRIWRFGIIAICGIKWQRSGSWIAGRDGPNRFERRNVIHVSRREAEEFANGFTSATIFLDQPDWNQYGFQPLLDLWQDQHRQNRLPARGDIDLVLVPDLVPLIQVYQTVNVAGHQVEAKIVYQGAMLADITREETGTLAFNDDFIDTQVKRSYRAYLDFALHWPYPIWVEGPLTDWRRKKFRKERYMSLPLSSDGKTIDGAITASYFFERSRLS